MNLAKFLRTPFLQNTSVWLLLLLAFQKQPPEVFYEKRCSWKFRKIQNPLVCEIFKNTFLQNTPGILLLAFSCNVTKMGYCQKCLEKLMNIHYLETLTLEVPFRYIIYFSAAWTFSVCFHWFTRLKPEAVIRVEVFCKKRCS